MLYLVKLDFEEMSQPLKVYSNRADAEREIEIAMKICASAQRNSPMTGGRMTNNV